MGVIAVAFASPSYRPHRLLASLPTATRLRRNYFTAYRSNYEEVVTAPAPRLAAGTAAGTAAITTTIPRNAPHLAIASARPSRRRPNYSRRAFLDGRNGQRAEPATDDVPFVSDSRLIIQLDGNTTPTRSTNAQPSFVLCHRSCQSTSRSSDSNWMSCPSPTYSHLFWRFL